MDAIGSSSSRILLKDILSCVIFGFMVVCRIIVCLSDGSSPFNNNVLHI